MKEAAELTPQKVHLMHMGEALNRAPDVIGGIISESYGDKNILLRADQVSPALAHRRARIAKQTVELLRKHDVTVITKECLPNTASDITHEQCQQCHLRVPVLDMTLARVNDPSDLAVSVDSKGRVMLDLEEPYVKLDISPLAIHALRVHGLVEAGGSHSGKIKIDEEALDEFLFKPFLLLKDSERIQAVHQIQPHLSAAR